MPHAEVAGRNLHYVREGEGEPLLLIQGLSGNHMHWGDDFLGLLHPHFDVIAYDHRGIGHSDPAGGPFTIADLADDAAGLLDALDIESAHVLGISMGGMTAQELALRHPEKVRTLALGCTYAGGADSAMTDPAVIQRLGELFMTGRIDEALRYGFEVNVSPAFAQDPARFEMVKEIAGQLPSTLDLLMLQVQAVAGHDTSDRLGEIEAPTLVIHGTVDQMLPVSNAHAIAARIPGARLEILEDVGHAFWWERPEESARFVRELASGASVES
jgi:pimeloyl-ACP methyl ester carboxylesterase